MKLETRVNATLSVENVLKEKFGEMLVPVTVNKKDCFAYDTGIVDEETGKPVYATLSVTIKGTKDTEDSPAFDLQSAVQARIDKENTPKKERKESTSQKQAKKEANAAKRNAELTIVRDWCLANLTDTPMHAQEIKNAIPEMVDVTIMQVGKYLKQIAEGEMLINRVIENGKPGYTAK